MALVLDISSLQLQPDMATAKNDRKENPLHEASRVGELEIVKLLLDACPSVAYMLNGDKESALFIACSCGHSEVALELCSRMDFRACNEIGASCLQIAASNGYTDIVRKIIGQNPSLATRRDEKGFSALHLASSKGNLGVITELLEKDPNLSLLGDNNGRTLLHLAMIYNQVHVVKEFLRERPGPASFNVLLLTDLVNMADYNGDTILHLAAKITRWEIIEILLSMPGIKVNAANSEGDTALDILEQILARNNDAADVLKQKQIPASDGVIDSYRRRMAIIKQLKARESAIQVSLTAMQLKLIVVAGLILTGSFLAVLSLLGGLWQDSVQGNHTNYIPGGNHTNHIPGKAIQCETNPGLFTFFMASDAWGFLVFIGLDTNYNDPAGRDVVLYDFTGRLGINLVVLCEFTGGLGIDLNRSRFVLKF